MDFTLLKSFIAVADEKSFSTAARHLFLSQQSLSKQIAKLEEELGEKVMTTVATGGLAKDLVKSCKRDIIYNGEL